MNFTNSINTFFRTPMGGSAADAAVRDAFLATMPALDAALQVLEPYTSLANAHRNLASTAGPAGAEDLEPYTEAILDAHTEAMYDLSTAFDALTDAFDTFSTDHDIYRSAAGLYQAYCEYYGFVVAAYSYAASCAVGTALSNQLQAVKDHFVAIERGLNADRTDGANRACAKAEADRAKSRAIEDEVTAKSLQTKAEHATKLAEVLRDIARHCEKKAAEAVGNTP
jgi:hypothetical protein